MLRMIPPEAVREFARRHDAELFQCVGNILKQDLSHCGDEVRETAGLPLILGGLGLRSAERVRVPAYWASWADCLQMIREKHPSVAMECVHQLEGQPTSPELVAAVECARVVTGAAGFKILRGGLQPGEHDHPCGMCWNLSLVARREDGNTRLPAV